MAWFRLLYHHITYWTIGSAPEAHHANLAGCWFDLNRYENCIEHCQKYLACESSDNIKSVMAYSHAALGDWEQALTVYRSIAGIWSDHSYTLGLAEAELRCGNLAEARKIIATIEVSDPNYDVALTLERMKAEMDSLATNE